MANKTRNIITSYCSAKGKQRNIFLSGYISGKISVNALKKKKWHISVEGNLKNPITSSQHQQMTISFLILYIKV